MKLKKPRTENERLFTSVILVFIVYFGLNSIIFAVFGADSAAVHYLMTISFLGGMIVGVAFFLWSRPSQSNEGSISNFKKNLDVLKRALNEDEKALIEMISETEGVTQDSLRFKTGLSKSKVSTLLSEMEKNGIIIREKLGRTHKLFISDWLKK
jgi:predicted HTH transcriptional regulator